MAFNRIKSTATAIALFLVLTIAVAMVALPEMYWRMKGDKRTWHLTE